MQPTTTTFKLTVTNSDSDKVAAYALVFSAPEAKALALRNLKLSEKQDVEISELSADETLDSSLRVFKQVAEDSAAAKNPEKKQPYWVVRANNPITQ